MSLATDTNYRTILKENVYYVQRNLYEWRKAAKIYNKYNTRR